MLLTEMERHELVQDAIQAADRIVMQRTAAHREEQLLVTSLLAQEFVAKLVYMTRLEAQIRVISHELDFLREHDAEESLGDRAADESVGAEELRVHGAKRKIG